MSDRVVKREKDKGKYNDIRSEREKVCLGASRTIF